VLPSSCDSFPHLIKKRGSQLGFVTHLLTYLRTYRQRFLNIRLQTVCNWRQQT